MTATRPPLLSLTPSKAIVLLVLLGWLAYANSLTKTFHLDDNLWILTNDDLHSWSDNLRMHPTRPVIALTLTANWKINGYDPISYHIFNALIHMGAALSLFGVVRRTLLLPHWQGRWDDAALPLAFATAAVWIVHPLNTHAVTYIIQRCESGMGLGYAFAMYCLIRGSQSPRPFGWYLGSIVAAWVGVGCKEVIVTILAVAPLYDRMFLANSWWESIRRRWLYYLGLATILALPLQSHIAIFLGSHAGDLSVGFNIAHLDPWTYFRIEMAVLPHYLRQAVWPSDLCFEYRDWPAPEGWLDYVPGLVGLTVVFLACLYGCFRRNGVAFLGMTAFLVLSMTSSFLPLLDVCNEYRMYVPLMALTAIGVIGGYLLLARLWPALARRPLARAALLAPIVAGLLVVTFFRNEDYRTSLSLWEDALEKRPTNYKILHHIGAAYEMDAKWPEAKEKHLLCLQHLPGHFYSIVDLGMIYYREGKTEEGLKFLKQAFQAYNTSSDTNTALATFNHFEGNSKEAIELLDFNLRIDPNKAQPLFHRAQILADMGRADEARAAFDDASRRFPDWPEDFIKYARARLRGRFGDHKNLRREALFYAAMANGCKSTVETLTTLADAYAWVGQYDKAAATMGEAIAMAADQPGLQRNLEARRAAFEKQKK